VKRANSFAVKVLDDQRSGPISELNVVSQRVASFLGNSAGGTMAGTTDQVEVVDIPQPGGQRTNRVVINANHLALLNHLPTFLGNNTDSATARLGDWARRKRAAASAYRPAFVDSTSVVPCLYHGHQNIIALPLRPHFM
jgi:hypothetical protein